MAPSASAASSTPGGGAALGSDFRTSAPRASTASSHCGRYTTGRCSESAPSSVRRSAAASAAAPAPGGEPPGAPLSAYVSASITAV